MVEDRTPQQVWEALLADPQAHVVDVRTDAEWAFVGLPDLSEADRQPVLLPWQLYPSMQGNTRFVEQLAQAGLTPDHQLFFLCRSGVRSLAAAEAAQAAGYARSYNVADGFEGPPDAHGHRGVQAGWKAAGLPWRQR